MKSPDRWQRVQQLFHRAVELTPAERQAFLSEKSAEDPEVLQEVESLLGSHDEASHFLESSPVKRLGLDPFSIAPGSPLGDFVIQKKLGQGSFAAVYLAHELTLNRKVAVKISRDIGEEGRTLASLEHDHIVKVFSETVDKNHQLRLMCLQLVSGLSLEELFQRIEKKGLKRVDGAALLKLIDEGGDSESAFIPSALKDREELSRADPLETVLWIGIRLASALSHAHQHGVLHLDVKPSNILVSSYGRPLLTDFNVSVARRTTAANRVLGGTRHYMAPEQLALFEEEASIALKRIDERADVYALGKVLQQMGERFLGKLPAELTELLGHATEPSAEARLKSAEALAEGLRGCLELAHVARAMPEEGPVARFARQHPWTTLCFLSLAPQVLGSAFNISYNAIWVLGDLSSSQMSVFHFLCVVYNAIFYPLGIWVFLRGIAPVARVFSRAEPPPIDDACRDPLRREVRRLPRAPFLGTTLGWMPGSFLFPWGIDQLSGPIPLSIYGHFLLSFALSWCVAFSYAFLATQFIAIRVYYPETLPVRSGVRASSRRELKSLATSVRFIYFGASFVPLLAAFAVVLVGPETLDARHYHQYQVLLALLIAAGVIGLAIAIRATGTLTRTLVALTGTHRVDE